MPPMPTPRLPKSKIPTWERRRNPDRWRWNGLRRTDPRMPKLEAGLEASPVRVILYAVAGTLTGLGILLLTLR